MTEIGGGDLLLIIFFMLNSIYLAAQNLPATGGKCQCHLKSRLCLRRDSKNAYFKKLASFLLFLFLFFDGEAFRFSELSPDVLRGPRVTLEILSTAVHNNAQRHCAAR